MRIILPIERKLQSRPRFARRGNYVQTYEDSAMGAYKQKAKPELIEKGAIFAHITFYIATPKYLLSSKKKRLEVKLERKYCDKKPDLIIISKQSLMLPKVFYIKTMVKLL